MGDDLDEYEERVQRKAARGRLVVAVAVLLPPLAVLLFNVVQLSGGEGSAPGPQIVVPLAAAVVLAVIGALLAWLVRRKVLSLGAALVAAGASLLLLLGSTILIMSNE